MVTCVCRRSEGCLTVQCSAPSSYLYFCSCRRAGGHGSIAWNGARFTLCLPTKAVTTGRILRERQQRLAAVLRGRLEQLDTALL